uniref:CSON009766 protein n=1 Tax=Culicoides sonorensis TaxID=179676 RepID=A0A336M4J8_CULSO
MAEKSLLIVLVTFATLFIAYSSALKCHKCDERLTHSSGAVTGNCSQNAWVEEICIGTANHCIYSVSNTSVEHQTRRECGAENYCNATPFSFCRICTSDFCNSGISLNLKMVTGLISTVIFVAINKMYKL